MPIRMYDAAAEASLDAKLALLNGGRIQIRDVAQPAVNGAEAGNLVLEYVLPNPAFPASSADGTSATAAGNGLPINDDALVTADLAIASYGQAEDSGGNIQWTGDVGATGSGAAFELADLSPTLGDTVALTAINATELQQGT